MKANLADGTVLNFPDGTDPAVVQATVKRVIASRGNASSGAQDASDAGGVGGTGGQAGPAGPEGFLKADGSSPLGERMWYGLAGSGISQGLGLKETAAELSEAGQGAYEKAAKFLSGRDLIKMERQPGLDAEDRDVLARSKADVENSGFAGKTANVVGNIAAAVAGSRARIGGVIPNTISLLGRYGPGVMSVGKAGLGSGALEAAVTPSEEGEDVLDSKWEAAKKAALAGGLIQGGANTLKAAGTGLFDATKDARELFKQGINPTLQQAADSWVGKLVGGLTSGTMGSKKRIEGEFLDTVSKEISGGRVGLEGTSLTNRVGNLTAGVTKDLDELMKGKKFPLTQKVREAMLQAADDIKGAHGQNVADQGAARKVLDNIVGELPGARPKLSYTDMKAQYIDQIDAALSKQGISDKVREALTNAKAEIVNAMEAKLKPDELAKLRDIQARQYDLDRLSNVSKSGAIGGEERVPVRKLADEYGVQPDAATNELNTKLIQPAQRVIGAAPNQNAARSFLISAGRVAAAGGAGLASIKSGFGLPMGALYGLSLIGQTGKGAKALTGQFPGQLALKEALESPQTSEKSLANLLRAIRDNTAAVGSAFTGN